MNIVVLICDGIYGKKPVWIDHREKLYEKNLDYVGNPSDLHAMDLAMAMKRDLDTVNVTAISVGNERAEDLVRKSMLIGADRGIWGDSGNASSEIGCEVGYALAKVIERHCRDFDLLLLGDRSHDFGFGWIGTILANAFRRDYLDNVSFIESLREPDSTGRGTITFHKKLEKGERLVCECATPVILGVSGSGNGIRGTDLEDLIVNTDKEIECVKMESLRDSFDGRNTGDKLRIVFDGYYPPRPRPKKIPVPDSSSSATDRLRSITAGCTPKKETSIVEGEPERVAAEFVRWIAGNR